MLKKVLSIFICAALVLSTFAFTVSADTVILVDGYTNADGNFYSGGSSYNDAVAGWTVASPNGWANTRSDSYGYTYVKFKGTAETNIYSFGAAEYKITAFMDGENGNGTATVLTVGGEEVGTNTIARNTPQAYVWNYTSTEAGTKTIQFNAASGNVFLAYIRVEQVGDDSGESGGETTDPDEGEETDTPSISANILKHDYTSADGNYYLAVEGTNTLNGGYTISGGGVDQSTTIDGATHYYGRFYNNGIATSAYTLTAGTEYTIYAKVGGEGSSSAVQLEIDDVVIGKQTVGQITNYADFIELSWTYTPATTGNPTIEFLKSSNNIFFDYMRIESAAPTGPVVYAINSVKGSDGVEITEGAADISYDITSITVEFNQTIDQTVLDAITVTGADYSVAADDTKAVITISGLVPSGTYSLNIASLTNDAGTMEAASYTFTCEAAQLPAVASVTADGVEVADGDVIPYTTASIVVTFDTGINAASVNATSVALTGAAYTVAAVDNTAVITVSNDFRTLSPVTLAVSGVENVYGGAMAAAYTLNLTTSGVDKLVAQLEGEDESSWTYVQGTYGANIGETAVTMCGGDSSITSKELNLTAGTTYRIDVRAAKNSGYQNSATTRFNVTIGDKTEQITLPSEYDVFDVYSFEYTPAQTGTATIFIQRSSGYCNYDIDYVAVTAIGAANVIEFSAKADGATVTATIYGVDNGSDVYLALYGAQGELLKCYKKDFAGEDVVFTTEVAYSSAIAYLWADGTVTPLVPSVPVQ